MGFGTDAFGSGGFGGAGGDGEEETPPGELPVVTIALLFNTADDDTPSGRSTVLAQLDAILVDRQSELTTLPDVAWFQTAIEQVAPNLVTIAGVAYPPGATLTAGPVTRGATVWGDAPPDDPPGDGSYVDVREVYISLSAGPDPQFVYIPPIKLSSEFTAGHPNSVHAAMLQAGGSGGWARDQSYGFFNTLQPGSKQVSFVTGRGAWTTTLGGSRMRRFYGLNLLGVFLSGPWQPPEVAVSSPTDEPTTLDTNEIVVNFSGPIDTANRASYTMDLAPLYLDQSRWYLRVSGGAALPIASIALASLSSIRVTAVSPFPRGAVIEVGMAKVVRNVPDKGLWYADYATTGATFQAPNAPPEDVPSLILIKLVEDTEENRNTILSTLQIWFPTLESYGFFPASLTISGITEILGILGVGALVEEVLEVSYPRVTGPGEHYVLDLEFDTEVEPPVEIDTPVAVQARLTPGAPSDRAAADFVLAGLYDAVARGEAGPTAGDVEAALDAEGLGASAVTVSRSAAGEANERLVLGTVTYLDPLATPDSATVFDLARGSAQGRMQRADGTWVYELGHAARILEHASPGDKVRLSQTTLPGDRGARFERMTLRIVAPPKRTGRIDTWAFRVFRDEVLFYERTILPNGRALAIRDVVVPWMGAADEATVTAELELLGWSAGGEA